MIVGISVSQIIEREYDDTLVDTKRAKIYDDDEGSAIAPETASLGTVGHDMGDSVDLASGNKTVTIIDIEPCCHREADGEQSHYQHENGAPRP